MTDTSKISKHISPVLYPQFLKMEEPFNKFVYEIKPPKTDTYRPINIYLLEEKVKSILDGTYAPSEIFLKGIVHFFEDLRDFQNLLDPSNPSNKDLKYINPLNILKFLEAFHFFSKYEKFIYYTSTYNDHNIVINREHSLSIRVHTHFITYHLMRPSFYSKYLETYTLRIKIISEGYLFIEGRLPTINRDFNFKSIENNHMVDEEFFINFETFANLLKENFQ